MNFICRRLANCKTVCLLLSDNHFVCVQVSAASGRHSYGGWSVMSDYLVVDMTNMTEVGEIETELCAHAANIRMFGGYTPKKIHALPCVNTTGGQRQRSCKTKYNS